MTGLLILWDTGYVTALTFSLFTHSHFVVHGERWGWTTATADDMEMWDGVVVGFEGSASDREAVSEGRGDVTCLAISTCVCTFLCLIFFYFLVICITLLLIIQHSLLPPRLKLLFY
ncbi:T. brucei spp.-specific protein [Trypanosoma brucei gambiense DAL972]|uniref:T. brucei spp.-specific protein n=1 Tax=Trypanosoma brucei gambiense (strain MHOM/CI/86/DAL972) TaxID=679716 RepID=D0A6S4_TRYB9|nr:T. brucei spp.-specific protein [Trypanosoma brucei gambiense DAL972]CBH17375.1 T. brucei spp.-specific protein [Trypanosoma brucei gambiense DAL972]|eukprot:XP_011779639.1 T. brucei spp.-specific protein [Trypanosoma brucei gambiense DAL972]